MLTLWVTSQRVWTGKHKQLVATFACSVDGRPDTPREECGRWAGRNALKDATAKRYEIIETLKECGIQFESKDEYK